MGCREDPDFSVSRVAARYKIQEPHMTKRFSPLFHSALKRVPRHRHRFAAVSVGCIQVLLLMSATICAQDAPVVARFRQATDAMRAGRLDAAGDQFASIAKDSPQFA